MTLVACVAVRDAIRWYDAPIGGVLVDPDLVVSSTGLPTWDGIRQGLRFPHRIVAVEGRELDELPREARLRAWDAAVARAAAGPGRAALVVEDRDGERHERSVRVERIGAQAWWTYAGTLFLAGILYAGAGLLAMWASPRGPLARAFARSALAAGAFCLTLFDFHTARNLVPVFFVAFATLPFTLVELAFRLPDDVRWLARRPWIARVLSATSGALALALLLTHASGRSTLPLRSFVTPLLGASLLLFAAVFLGRLVRARGERRRTLASLFGAMAMPYSLAGACLFLQRWGVAKAHLDILSTPLLALAPVANVAAFVRHDLWESRALLSRVLARGATVLAAGVVAVGVGTAVTYSSGGSFAHTFGAVAVGAALASALALPSLAMLDRALFGARAEYKPTVEQLSEELASIASRDEVARAVERTVQRWLPCDDVRLVTMRTEWSEPSGIRPASSGPAPELELAGYRSIDVCFRGTCLARLTVGPKRGGALFTSEDMDLLRTIANQGALALAHASAYAQLDDRRRQQMSAWRGERTAIVETVAAEIAHEIRYPLNFFRAMIARASRTGGLRPADIEVGSEEVRRLEKLVTGLRTKTGPNAAREAVRLADVCARAEVLLRDVLDGRSLEVAVGDAALTCDADQLTQVLVNLVSNSLEATGPSGRVGVMWRAGRSGDALLCVWDDGPGFDDDPAQIFAPWYTTKPRGTGLGLAITHRIVRAHGWSIDARRERDRTVLSISVPDRDIVREVGEVA